MIKRTNSTLLLSIFILSLIFCVDINTATQGYVPRNADIDRSNIPKNILVGSFMGGRSHLKPMFDIAAVLIERGSNVGFFLKRNENCLLAFFFFDSFYLVVFLRHFWSSTYGII